MPTETPSPSVTELCRRVDSLQQRVDALEKFSRGANIAEVPPPDLSELERSVLHMTRELFPGEVSIRTVEDPDFPGDTYRVVEATAVGTVADIVDRRILWHQRVVELSGDCASRGPCLSLSDQA